MSALAVGTTVVLYDGSPFVPSPNVLWDCVDKFGYVHIQMCDIRFIHAGNVMVSSLNRSP